MRARNIAIAALLGTILPAVTLFAVFNMTNPSDGGPAVILIVLTLIYILTYSIVVLVTVLLGHIYRLIAPATQTTTSEEKKRRHLRKTLAVCAVLAASPIFIISLNSIGRMEFVDAILIVATEALAIFYIVKKV